MTAEHEHEAQYVTKMEPLRGLRALKQMSAFSFPLLVTLVLILAFQLLPSRYQLNEGDVVRHDIKSPQKVSYISQIKTKEERDRAENAVSPIMVPDTVVADQQKQKLLDIGGRISEIRKESATIQQKRDSVQKIPNLVMPSPVIDDILNFDEPSWRAALNEAVVILDATMKEKITDKQLNEVKGKIPSLVSPQLSPAQAGAAIKLAENFVKPNQIIDEDATAKAKKAARDAVPPVRMTIEMGEMILRDGDIVKATDVEKLEAAGLRNPNLQWPDLLGTIVLVFVLLTCLAFYLLFFQPSILANGRRLTLLGLVIVLAVLSAKLMMPGRELWGYLFLPAAAAAMLVSTLLSPQLAVVTTVVISVLVGFITNFSLEMTTLSLASGLVGLLGARKIERMNAFFLTGVAVAMVKLNRIALRA